MPPSARPPVTPNAPRSSATCGPLLRARYLGNSLREASSSAADDDGPQSGCPPSALWLGTPRAHDIGCQADRPAACSSRHVDLSHVRTLNHDGHDAFSAVEHVAQLATHPELDPGDSIELEGVAAHHVEDLILLVPPHDRRVARRVERHVGLVRGGPDNLAALSIFEEKVHFTVRCNGMKCLPDVGLALALL